MPQTFSLVEIGPSNDHSADFVRCFYNYVFAFEKAFSAVQSSEERLDIPHLIKLANFLRASDSEFVHLTLQSSVALSETSSLMGEKEAILIEIQRRKTLNPSPNSI